LQIINNFGDYAANFARRVITQDTYKNCWLAFNPSESSTLGPRGKLNNKEKYNHDGMAGMDGMDFFRYRCFFYCSVVYSSRFLFDRGQPGGHPY
jgi:hypothetical protein